MKPNLLRWWLAVALLCLASTTPSWAAGNIKIGIDAEFGVPQSTSAQAIRNGAQVAVNEINAGGGVLGQQLEIVERDNRAVPARSLVNLRELAQDPDVVAVLAGRISPVVVEALPEVHKLKLPLLVPWAAANGITDNDYSPSYVFRLSIKDSLALSVMMRHALKLGARNVGLLVPNTEWGRSSLKSAEETALKETNQNIVATRFYNWGDKTMLGHYQPLQKAGAQAIIFVANDREATVLLTEMAGLPKEDRLPIVAHWGLTGGQFFENSSAALKSVDLTGCDSK